MAVHTEVVGVLANECNATIPLQTESVPTSFLDASTGHESVERSKSAASDDLPAGGGAGDAEKAKRHERGQGNAERGKAGGTGGEGTGGASSDGGGAGGDRGGDRTAGGPGGGKGGRDKSHEIRQK